MTCGVVYSLRQACLSIYLSILTYWCTDDLMLRVFACRAVIRRAITIHHIPADGVQDSPGAHLYDR